MLVDCAGELCVWTVLMNGADALLSTGQLHSALYGAMNGWELEDYFTHLRLNKIGAFGLAPLPC